MIFSQKNFINVGFLRLFRAARLVKLLRFSKTSNIINYLGQLQISSIILDNFKYHQLSWTTSNIIKYLGQLQKYQQLSWTTSKIINYLGQLLKYHQSSWTTSNIFKCLRRDHDYDHLQLSTQLST